MLLEYTAWHVNRAAAPPALAARMQQATCLAKSARLRARAASFAGYMLIYLYGEYRAPEGTGLTSQENSSESASRILSEPTPGGTALLLL